MAASITPPFDYTEGGAHPTAHADNTATDNINTWLKTSTIANLDNTNFNAANVDGVAGTPSLRTLGSGAQQAASGTDSRLSDARTGTGLKFGSTVIPCSSSVPAVGTFLKYDGSNIIGANPGAGANITGTGTVTTSIGSPTVTGSGTKFTVELQPGYLIVVNSETQRILSIASDTSLTTTANWAGANAGAAFTYIISVKYRPFDRTVVKTSSFTVQLGDAGSTFACDPTGGAITATLPAASSFLDGDTLTFVKTTDNVNAITITPNGTDTIDGLNTSKSFKAYNNAVTIQHSGSGQWTVVAERYRQGLRIQSKRVQSSAVVSAISQSVATLPTGAVTTSSGKEVLTGSSALVLTPTSANNVLRVRGLLFGSTNGGGVEVAAIVSDGSVVRCATVKQFGDASDRSAKDIPFEFTYVPGSLSAITFKLAVAVNNNVFNLNSDPSGTQFLGGSLFSWIEVTEEAQ